MKEPQQEKRKKNIASDTRAVILKQGKDAALRRKHRWIFSGAILSLPELEDGDILPVQSSNGDFLGWGYFNRQASIIGRMISFDSTEPLEAIQKNMQDAYEMRRQLLAEDDTNAYRIINGEGDGLPGLIVDRYNKILVVQLSTLGMEKLRPTILEYLHAMLAPEAIYEKSVGSARREEKLDDFHAIHYGSVPDTLMIREKGLQFKVSILEGQKTGFFFDHREMRQHIRQLARQQRVLNCFAYTGGFSVYAAAGGAVGVDSVEISGKSLEMAKENMQLNGFQGEAYGFFAADVFQFLREHPLDYGIVILDPPAFAKRRKDIIQACRGYKDINRLAIQKMPARSLLLTSSCSYFVDEALFQKVVFQASVEAGRTVKIIGRHHMAVDHPVNICHPEGDYLKSLLLYIE
jgi:23S rRNA (cytosine1962-C5)-methyltransferase